VIARIVGLAALAWVAWAAFVFLAQRGMLYPGAGRDAPAGPPPIPGLERLRLDIPGARVESWLLPAEPTPGDAGPALVHFHGNGELIDDWPHLVDGLRRRGWAVLLVEFPGYGRSSGKPTERSITEAALAAFDALAARPDVDPARIVAYGRSLGAGAACRLATRRPVAALALTSPFTSVRAFARGYLVPGFLTLDPFDNVAAVAAYDGPVLVSHGRFDDVIPYRHGVAVAAAARRGRLVTMECAHNDCPPDMEAHWADVAALLDAP
jgi:fermentation-respiration switch protein FrsA (DUF1100 family)